MSGIEGRCVDRRHSGVQILYRRSDKVVKAARTARASLVLPLLLSTVPAYAQGADADTTAATYRMLLALIDEMIDAGVITREKANALIARTQATGVTQRLVASDDAKAPDAAPPARQAVPGGAKDAPMAPVSAGPVRVADARPDMPADMKVDWGRGAPLFSSRDGRFSFKPRGRILVDLSSTDGSRYDDRNVTVSTLRQLRFGGQGTIGSHLFYQLEVDYRRNQTEVNNTFVGYRTRLGQVDADIRAGALLTDRGIDVATAAQANPFIMLNVNALALAPQGGIFVMGAAARAGGPDWHATLAVHGDPVDGDYSRSDNRAFMVRAHWNPWMDESSAVHLGGWAYDEALSNRDASITIAPLMTGALNTTVRVQSPQLSGVGGSRAFGTELGAFLGPVYGYAEYGERRIKAGPSGRFDDGSVRALSISGGWWITGEKAPYQARSGTFVAPQVLHRVMGGSGSGLGGVEIVGRYEWVDLSALPDGGKGAAITLGVNWHLTNYFRLLADVNSWRTSNVVGAFSGRDRGTTITTRAEVSF